MADLHVVVLAAGKGTRMTFDASQSAASGGRVAPHRAHSADRGIAAPRINRCRGRPPGDQLKEAIGKRLGLAFAVAGTAARHGARAAADRAAVAGCSRNAASAFGRRSAACARQRSSDWSGARGTIGGGDGAHRGRRRILTAMADCPRQRARSRRSSSTRMRRPPNGAITRNQQRRLCVRSRAAVCSVALDWFGQRPGRVLPAGPRDDLSRARACRLRRSGSTIRDEILRREQPEGAGRRGDDSEIAKERRADGRRRDARRSRNRLYRSRRHDRCRHHHPSRRVPRGHTRASDRDARFTQASVS